MSICFLEATEQEKIYLQENLPGKRVQFFDQPLVNPAQLEDTAAITVLSPFVHSYIGADILDSMPNLKLIATRSTGTDHIDIGCALDHGVQVANVPTYGEITVAEHTFALILALSRNVHKASSRTYVGNFSMDGLQGFDLYGKVLGVIGTGHIGLNVIKIANGFSMRVVAYDPFPNSEAANLLNYDYMALEELLNVSDVVTLHAPLLPQTHHLIGRHNICEFKRGALLINTSRGGLVDTDALLKGLDERILSGAGLDVLEGEEIFSEEKQLLGNPHATNETLRMALRNVSLLRRPNLVITPHIGFDSKEAVERILETTVRNIQQFFGGSPQNIIRR